MKILTSFYNYTPSGNATSGYPLSNLKTIDTNEIWKGTGNSETINIDLGSAKAVSAVFLNNANFTSASITVTNSSDYTGGTTKNFTLAKDNLDIIRGFCEIGGGSSYRYVKVVCSSIQSGSLIQLGNLIIGNASVIQVASWSADIEDNLSVFKSDGGAYREKRKGQSRHSFSASFTGPLSRIKSLPLSFDNAVIFTDLGYISDSYLIGIPQNRKESINNPLDSSFSLVFKETI